jgi:acyl-CoA synthetase (AMP-forming)/AMP-acid ligase II/acyl carrier protein
MRFLAAEEHGSVDALECTARSSDVAFLQYTSGSTGSPKGVVVTHANLASNGEMIRSAFGLGADLVGVGWLPLFHDMGLIGNVLQPVHLGRPCVLMSPMHFLQKPLRWLQAISRYRATISGGPNFAYEACVERIGAEQAAGLDLSSWRTAFNGAEPVRADTMRRFADAFAGCGFRREAFAPCYGLAEATLLVTGCRDGGAPSVEALDRGALADGRAVVGDESQSCVEVVGCGRPAPPGRVRVVHPESTLECEEGYIGEIWTAGPAVAGGYWNEPDEISEGFGARLADGLQELHLRTGDLGYLRGGELFVTGRLKDLIIINGKNFLPQDIERTVEGSHPAMRAGCGVAFSITLGGDEAVVVVQEIQRAFLGMGDGAEVIRRIGAAILERHGLIVHSVLLVKPGAVPRTTSGKVRRRAAREAFLQGEFEAVAALAGRRGGPVVAKDYLAPRTPTEVALVELCARLLGTDRVGVRDDFFDLGGHSLLATQLVARVRDVLHVPLSLSDLFDLRTVEDMAARIEAMRAAGLTSEESGIARLPRIQRSLAQCDAMTARRPTEKKRPS